MLLWRVDEALTSGFIPGGGQWCCSAAAGRGVRQPGSELRQRGRALLHLPLLGGAVLNLNRLRILMELHRQGTLAEVAAELHYTPSAVSQQMATFERELGVKLLQKVGRNVKLTDAALVLVRHGAAVFAAMDAAEAELANESGPAKGTIRVASFPSVLLSIAPNALTLLAESHPDLNVVLVQRDVEEAQEGLQSHAFDLVLGEEYPDEPQPPVPGLHREDFYADPLRLAVPAETGPGEAAPDAPGEPAPRRLSDFAQTPWAIEPTSTRTGRWCARALGMVNVTPRVACETTDPLLHVHLARTGHAVSFVPGLVGSEHLSGVDLWDLPGNPHRQLFTEVREGREDHPAIKVVRAALARAAEEMRIHPSAGQLL